MQFRIDASQSTRVLGIAGTLLAALSLEAIAAPPSTTASATASPSSYSFASGPGGTWQVTITDLGTLPGGIYSSAYAINDTGKIVGMAYDSNGALKTVQWLNGQISTIPGLSPSAASVPDDVNDAGEISGRQQVFSGGIYYGIYWDAGNHAFELPGIPGGLSNLVRAHAINASGQIAGMGQQGAPNYFGHAAVWSKNAFQTDLGFMGGGSFSEAYGINDLGEVVGVAAVANTNQHAFFWKNGQFTDLSSWSGGGASSIAYGINNHGMIVGLNASVASTFSNGAVHPLPMPPGISAFTPAIDINDSGDIIATASKGYPLDVGVLWRNGVPIDLGTLPGGTISRARRINQTGEIVGEANAANGFFHAVKWTVIANPWTDLGHALAGTSGLPVLTGGGALEAGSTLHWKLSNAKSSAPAWIVVGFSQIDLPFAGGLVVPAPDIVLPTTTSMSGALALDLFVPSPLPSSQSITTQAWILDPSGIAGFSASNAITRTAP